MPRVVHVHVPQPAHLVHKLRVRGLQSRDFTLLFLILPGQLLVIPVDLLVQLAVSFVELKRLMGRG